MKLAIGAFTRFGKIYFKFRDRDYDKIHYLICKEKRSSRGNGYTAICLEYNQVVWDEKEENSLKMLRHNTKDYLEKMNESPGGRMALYEQLRQNTMEPYWGIYRQLMKLYGDPELKHTQEMEKENTQLKGEMTENILELEEKITELKVDMDSLKKKMKELEDGRRLENAEVA